MSNQPRVGLGVLIFHGQKVLLGKRILSHGTNTWSPPGGHLEYGESLEECAIREVKEETDLTITTPEFLAVTNDIFEAEQKHYVTIFMVANYPEDQVVVNKEPDKTASWEWIDIKSLPQKLFLPMKNLIDGEGLEVLLELTGMQEDEV